VKTNRDASRLAQDSTLQRYLHDAGYRTGIFGKFLNRWDLSVAPPFFDRRAIFNGSYYNNVFNVDGTLTDRAVLDRLHHVTSDRLLERVRIE